MEAKQQGVVNKDLWICHYLQHNHSPLMLSLGELRTYVCMYVITHQKLCDVTEQNKAPAAVSWFFLHNHTFISELIEGDTWSRRAYDKVVLDKQSHCSSTYTGD